MSRRETMGDVQRPEEEARLSIGALSRAVGVPVETLRTWENRYGFPVPERKPSGHRVYPISFIPRLRRIAAALSHGHRAAEVVGASEEALCQLLDATPSASPQPPPSPLGEATAPDGIEHLLGFTAAFDSDRLTRALLGDWTRMSPVEFLERRIAPLVRRIGEEWAAGRLEVRHEHFLAERVGDLLRSLKLRLEESVTGPLMILATLPGEHHGLGLQMAAVVVAAAGCRVLYLGTNVPHEEMITLGRDLGAAALGLSISVAARGAETEAALRRLRSRLPRRIRLLAGGEGAPRGIEGLEGLEVVSNLHELDRWARSLVAAQTPPLSPAPPDSQRRKRGAHV